jgi:hypothetical protein
MDFLPRRSIISREWNTTAGSKNVASRRHREDFEAKETKLIRNDRHDPGNKLSCAVMPNNRSVSMCWILAMYLVPFGDGEPPRRRADSRR